MHLYVGSKRYSSWSLRPYVALAESGLPFECTTILLDQPTTKAEIAKVNPAAKVPVLHHEGQVIWDSLAICEFVAELSKTKLWPEDRMQRAKARSISCEMHSSFAALRKHMSMELHATRPTPTDPEALADAKRIQTIWSECLASSGGRFLFGDTFSIADAMFAPVTTRFTTYQVPVDARIKAYIETIAALPSMKQWAADAANEPVSR